MPPRIALFVVLLLLVSAFAHAGSPCCEFCADQYQQEGQFPYFEVIRTRRLIPDTEVVTAEGWKRIFESCAEAERVNITASTDVTVVGRAFLQLTDQSTPDIGVEYRWVLDDAPLTAAQRTTLRNRARTTNPILQASINVIGALDIVSQAVGQPAAAVRELYEEANRWTAVEDELRATLNGVAGANLVRRQRITAIASRAFTIGEQLARDPAHAALVPHVAEIKRLKSFNRRKKAAQTPGSPSSPVPGTTFET
jgi:hypothetical protein